MSRSELLLCSCVLENGSMPQFSLCSVDLTAYNDAYKEGKKSKECKVAQTLFEFQTNRTEMG